MTTINQPSIDIENVGPIKSVSIPVPKDGGVVVLRGRNGSGKSTALDAAGKLIAGNGAVQKRDGALAGHVNGLGVTIKVGARTTRNGEIEVESLADRLSIADIVDPGLKDAASADKRRVKAMAALAGVEPSPDLFEGAPADLTPEPGEDVVTYAERVRRRLHEMARTRENSADDYTSREQGIRSTLLEGDEVPRDAEEVRYEHRTAIESLAALEARAKQAKITAGAQAEAREKLKTLPDKADAKAMLSRVTSARHELTSAEEELRDAEIELNTAQMHARAREQCEQALADVVKAPTPKAIAKAQGLVEKCEEAARKNDQLRAQTTDRKTAEQFATGAAEMKAEAEAFRKHASGVDDVLSGLVQSDRMRVVDGRLVTDTARGETLFADLSEGERWAIALDIGIEAVGENGVIIVPQEAWEGLDPTNRRAVVEHVAGRHVTVLTAEAADGDLAAEVA